MFKKALCFGAVALLAAACSDEPSHPQSSYALGFTPFPYSTQSFELVLNDIYTKLKTDGNLVSHHFDDGIPWNEALDNTTYPSDILNDWTYRKQNTPSTHKILLSVTPISITRNGLAPYRNNNGGDQPLPTPWDTYAFNHTNVKAAFLNHCKRIVSFFNPDYFVIGIESNLLMINEAAQWPAYMELHQYVYTELKKEYPDLPIFVSLTGYDLGGFTDAVKADQLKALNELIPYCDYFGLSLHPQFSIFLADKVPSVDELKSIFTQADKPIAICETSYPAQNFTIYGGSLVYNGTEEKQRAYFQNLFAACDHFNTKLIVNFVLKDYDPLWQEIGSPDDYNKIWRDTGFYGDDAQERSVLQLWRSKLR